MATSTRIPGPGPEAGTHPPLCPCGIGPQSVWGKKQAEKPMTPLPAQDVPFPQAGGAGADPAEPEQPHTGHWVAVRLTLFILDLLTGLEPRKKSLSD